jgi:valyl-tRNA synthetase
VCSDQEIFESNAAVIKSLARIESLTITAEKPDGEFVSFVEGSVEVLLDLSGAIDVEAERERIQKEIDHVAPYIKQLETKLAGPFADNAPEHIVEAERAKLVEANDTIQALHAQLDTLTS